MFCASLWETQINDTFKKDRMAIDPIEKNLAMQGDFKLIDSETGSMLRTYISPRLRVQYQQMLDAHIAKIEETCNKLGFHFFLVTTDTPIFDAFYRVLE